MHGREVVHEHILRHMFAYDSCQRGPAVAARFAQGYSHGLRPCAVAAYARRPSCACVEGDGPGCTPWVALSARYASNHVSFIPQTALECNSPRYRGVGRRGAI
eukprot:7438940-Pyramimonas_sp.AAC.1